MAELARLDQEIAAGTEGGLNSITKLAEAVTAEGKLLLKELLLRAQLDQRYGELRAKEKSTLPEEEKQAIDLALSESGEGAAGRVDADARRFISRVAEGMEVCLQWLADSISNEDLQSAQLFCEQASRLNRAMQEIQDSWPWLDLQAEQESWRQYQRGELMDFETFKNELLKAAK